MLKPVAFLSLLGWMSCASEPPLETPGPPPTGVAPQPLDQAPVQWPSTDPPIAFRSWTEETWGWAQERDLPVLLYLATPGGDGTFATGGAVLELLVEQQFTAIREDPFRRPDLGRRYGAGGWPTVALLLPDGRLFARAVDLPPDNARMFLWRLRGNYEKRRAQIVDKVESAEAVAGKPPSYDLDVDGVFFAAAAAYDRGRGGFGEVRKFPEPSVLEFLLEYARQEAGAAAQASDMVFQTLDHLLSSPMVADGGVAAFSRTPDWRTPAAEYDAADQAGMLRVLLTVAAGEARFEPPARALVGYIERNLYRPGDGHFMGRKLGYRSASGERLWWTDPVPYADRNAVLISACMAAAEQLGDGTARQMALTAGDYLLERCIDLDGRVWHTCTEAGGELSGLLEDQLLATAALLDLFAVSGEGRHREGARRTMSFVEDNNYDPARGLYFDRPPTSWGGDRSLASFRDDLLPAGNGLAATMHVRTGDLERAAALLGGSRLRIAPDRGHATAALALLRYRGAITKIGEQPR